MQGKQILNRLHPNWREAKRAAQVSVSNHASSIRDDEPIPETVYETDSHLEYMHLDSELDGQMRGSEWRVYRIVFEYEAKRLNQEQNRHRKVQEPT